MTKMLLVALLALTSGAQAADWKAFVPTGHNVFQHLSIDLNGDGRPDQVLITQDKGGEEGHRILQVLLGTPSGYQLSAKNAEVVLCRECGGVWGDPFDHLTAGRGWIEVGDYGGSSWRWGNTYRFVWQRGYWLLQSWSQYSRTPGVVEKTIQIPPSECQNKELNHFVCGAARNKTYTVKAKRASVYQAPSLKARDKKYIIAGEKVKIGIALRNFAYGTYSAKDNLLEGYFRLQDLQQVK